MIITLVGGTVGGYISFAGAHRLLDAGIKGKGKYFTGDQEFCKRDTGHFFYAVCIISGCVGCGMAWSEIGRQ